jgi:GAF domain-containing protein
MFSRIGRWLAPPRFEDDEDRTSAAAVLNTLSLVVLVVVILFVLGNALFAETIEPLVMGIIAALLVVSVGSLVLLRLGYIRFVGLMLSLVLWAGFTLPALEFGGMHDTAISGYFVVIVLAGVAAGGTAALLFGLLTAASAVAIFSAEHLALIQVNIEPPSGYNDLILLVLLLGTAAVLLRYALRRIEMAYNRARRSAQALAETNVELGASRDALEAQTAALERRTRYLEATSEVAREASSMLDLEALLPRVVSLIGERFELFRLGIFLLDADGESAVLRAASGEGGRRLLAREFWVSVTGTGAGIVAHVIRSGQSYVTPDASQDPLYLEVEDVADARSEMTLPLRARGEILGALSVQSPETNAFSREDLVIMQTMADQVALAISNAQLFQQAQESLAAERRAYGELSQRAWQELVVAQPDLAVLRDKKGLSPSMAWLDAEVEEALETGRPATSEDGAKNLAVPIRVRGQVIGFVDAHRPEDSGSWTPEQIALLETIVDQLADALESARLYQDTQRRAAEEQLLGEVTARMRETLDVDTVLQTAIQEMGSALGLSRVEVRMGETRDSAAEGGKNVAAD